MASRRIDVPAIEHTSGGLLGKMSQPIGMNRRAFSYDDALEDIAPMTPPPSNMCSSILWKQPVIPERKYEELSKVEEGETSMHPSAITPSSSTETVNKVPVVKAKATHIIMNSLITKQTQESIQRFEQQAGLRDAGYTPHKGLTAEETKYHRVAESLHNLKMQSGEMAKEDKQTSSVQSTPSSTPHSSPKRTYRSWFSQGTSTSITGSDIAAMDSSGGDGDKVPSEKWSFFGPRALQKPTTDSGGFTIQAYKGAPKPTPMELMRAQATRMAEDPATFKPPKMDIPAVEEQRRSPRSHNLRPQDLNVLTPTGF
ncbi:putative monooxygenase p33MONOX [Rhineura floridana]|uniref:putative monooxygenase p33MONOX n=1 Tax=Rhineura floridana TaxID=261503 RepID=UPI002AC87E8F|nr:putative monooxygenase p33MONOX [Rhineura floridana]XP_061473511.1 putative monooxygenase p33MONOX [Rhineura floridana]XP_061473512.1 putative monooxygenase p33MONOX [Rhineura floridana]XP_061473513.1 putative monooxygenase p33MONOX [Rhineura floridana]